MIAISSEDYIEFLCPNIECESIDFNSVGEFEGYSIVRCNECGEKFYVSFSKHSSIWENGKPEINIIKHPKLLSIKEEKPLKK